MNKLVYDKQLFEKLKADFLAHKIIAKEAAKQLGITESQFYFRASREEVNRQKRDKRLSAKLAKEQKETIRKKIKLGDTVTVWSSLNGVSGERIGKVVQINNFDTEEHTLDYCIVGVQLTKNGKRHKELAYYRINKEDLIL